MKIIRPQNNTPTQNQLLDKITTLSQEYAKYDEELVDDNTGKDKIIENIMDEVLKQKDEKIQVTISLTKRQYDIYLKKGGESWVKRTLTGLKRSKK